MINFTNACSINQRLSKNTLLAMLPNNLDKTKAIVLATGEIISLENISESTILSNINSKIWTYYDKSLPRRILLTNPNWTITSFNPQLRNVCVTIYANSGIRYLNFTLPELATKFN